MKKFAEYYNNKICDALKLMPVDSIQAMFHDILNAWKKDAQLFICGNGGSAANALHIVNDLFYGIAKSNGKGIKAHALSANQSIITCFANDISYDEIFSRQLDVLGNPGDILLVLSGSGNSSNILQALKKAKELRMTSYAIVGFSGGKAMEIADAPLHIPVDDMQISEDMQLIIGHMLMQWLSQNNPHRN
jgi:D-sedoheptulose 7-phosphate isomerase